MAKLSAHGTELARIELLTMAKAYMSDGNILKNDGFGWKLYKKWKDGFNVNECVEKAVATYEKHLEENPAYREYRRLLHAQANLCDRWRFHETVKLMPEDPDGVWSTMDDYHFHCDFEEIAALCRAYLAERAEAKMKQVKVPGKSRNSLKS